MNLVAQPVGICLSRHSSSLLAPLDPRRHRWSSILNSYHPLHAFLLLMVE